MLGPHKTSKPSSTGLSGFPHVAGYGQSPSAERTEQFERQPNCVVSALILPAIFVNDSTFSSVADGEWCYVIRYPSHEQADQLATGRGRRCAQSSLDAGAEPRARCATAEARRRFAGPGERGQSASGGARRARAQERRLRTRIDPRGQPGMVATGRGWCRSRSRANRRVRAPGARLGGGRVRPRQHPRRLPPRGRSLATLARARAAAGRHAACEARTSAARAP